MRWSWNCGAVFIPVVFSDPWTPSLRISPIHPSFPWKIPERRTRRIKRLVPTDHRLFQAGVPQLADNVNSHPTSLGHGDPHQDPDRQRGKGKIPGSQRPASQAINHRTTSRRLPAAKHSTVSDVFPVTREV